MATMQDALRKALAEKRAQITREQGQVKPSIANKAEVTGTVRIKYVRCTKCREMQAWHAFTMNGARPTFCKCKPGAEDLVTFELEVKAPEEDGD